MHSGYHLDEAVYLTSCKPPSGLAGGATVAPNTSLTLREAVRVVVEDWSTDRTRQFSAVITRNSGPVIQRLDEIRTIYALSQHSPTL